MVKLSEGDDMRQLRIEVCGIPSYCMNIEECMSVEDEADGKPWYHDIKAYIKNNEYPADDENMNVRSGKLTDLLHSQFITSAM